MNNRQSRPSSNPAKARH